jgi:hypothetical protein
MPDPRRSIVLVHGAFARTSTWSKLISLLIAKGLSVVAAHCPLSSLADDVAAVDRVIGMQGLFTDLHPISRKVALKHG